MATRSRASSMDGRDEETDRSNFDYGSLVDPQSQPPAGTSVAPQNVSVPFVGSIFQMAGYGAAVW